MQHYMIHVRPNSCNNKHNQNVIKYEMDLNMHIDYHYFKTIIEDEKTLDPVNPQIGVLWNTYVRRFPN